MMVGSLSPSSAGPRWFLPGSLPRWAGHGVSGNTTRHRPYGGLGLVWRWMDFPAPVAFVAAFMLHLAWAA